jgi:hypothetical protein
MERPDAVRLTAMSHTIRLREFWDFSEADGLAVYSRNFGKPRLPDEHERVWLISSRLPASAEIRVNGEIVHRVTDTGPFALDITIHLRQRNTVSFTLPRGERPGEVTLEIRPPAN